MLLMISSNCFAMMFSQPVKVGSIGVMNLEGFSFNGAMANNGISMQNRRGRQLFSQGVVRFGNGRDALFFHYNYGTLEKNYKDFIMAFGSDNISNTVNVSIKTAKIFQIKSDSGITFYSVNDSYDLPEEFMYTLLGRRADGKWVKYFDTNELVKKYFGANQSYWLKELNVSGDTIIIYYELFSRGNYKNPVGRGEFRFKWDDKAQWFSIEQVIY